MAFTGAVTGLIHLPISRISLLVSVLLVMFSLEHALSSFCSRTASVVQRLYPSFLVQFCGDRGFREYLAQLHKRPPGFFFSMRIGVSALMKEVAVFD